MSIGSRSAPRLGGKLSKGFFGRMTQKVRFYLRGMFARAALS